MADRGLGRGVLLGDYDGDGDLDVYVINEGQPNRMHRNGRSQHSWIAVDVEGVESNRDGIGAHITAHTGDTRQLREVNGIDGFSMSSRTAHFGVGDHGRIDSLTVAWPSGAVDVHRNVPVNSKIHLVEGLRMTAVEQEGGEQAEPLQFGLEPNFPNPFNAETNIRYTVSRRGGIELAIYNSVGQLVRVLVEGEVEAGVYRKSWDGRDNSGRAAASGVYISRLVSEEEEAWQSIVLLR